MDLFIQKFADWLFQNGISTVLLFALLALIYKLGLSLIETLNNLQKSIDALRAEFTQSEKVITERFGSVRENIEISSVWTRERLKELIQAISYLLEKVSELLTRMVAAENETRISRSKAKDAYNDVTNKIDDMPKILDEKLSNLEKLLKQQEGQ